MAEPYLILHKVRGEPAFDIAERMCSGCPCQPECGLWDGEKCKASEWWIIPTSGHRAYPYIIWRLDKPLDLGPFNMPEDIIRGKGDWPHWADHYPTSASRTSLASAALDILSLMGVEKKLPEAVKRRKV